MNSKITEISFWKSINILINKPHVVNKRVWDCKILLNMKCDKNNMSRSQLLSSLESLRLNKSCNVEHFLERLLVTFCELKLEATSLELYVIEFLPRNYDENHAYQLIVAEKEKLRVTFYDITMCENKQNICPNFTYSFLYRTDKLILKTYSENSKTTEWLQESVLPQIVKWAVESDLDLPKNIYTESLSLIPRDKYYTKYNELKVKYGKELVKIWPECTDPSKFVYEDIAIATYLLLLWKDESNQSFVDVGCGNGLLVYILTMEGHNGIGVDIRKRGIWDMYPKLIKLEEKTITPDNIKTLSEYEWVIGNHSDELTPWIPVIAAQGSYNNKFFLLPCCAFYLDGTKYKRKNSSKSQYTEYLEYIKHLCEDFGFEVEIDRLKIPSTKRICLVGKMRTYQIEEYGKYCQIVSESINKTLGKNKEGDILYKTREKVELVRNCTQIDKDIIEWIVSCVAKFLIESCDFNTTWSPGREVEISDLIKLIPKNILKKLKFECGGLQTLLRNNYQIFQVINGKVQFRYPKSIEEVTKNVKDKKKIIKVQVKRCWFYDNHPQSCPLSDDNCSFLHVQKN